MDLLKVVYPYLLNRRHQCISHKSAVILLPDYLENRPLYKHIQNMEMNGNSCCRLRLNGSVQINPGLYFLPAQWALAKNLKNWSGSGVWP